MNKLLLTVAITIQLITQLYAGDDSSHLVEESNNIQTQSHEHEESNIYVIVKGLMVLGDKVDEGHAVLDGDQGYGYGIDIGYRFGHGFSIEYDFSYARNTVTDTVGEEVEEGNAKYYTSALDLVYAYEMSEKFVLFGKVGYEYEWENISEFHIDSRENGFNFGVGVEVIMTESYRFVVEYETATIEGPRGDSVFLGLLFHI